MATKNFSTKHKVLEILRNENSPVSGEDAAKLAGISRVAVWKAIQALQAAGYVISTSRAGYLLEKDLKDSLFPWEFGMDESSFFHFPETESTMTEARKIAQENSSHSQLEVITADKQTKGRGQAKHSWSTTKGSIACTLITHSKIAAAYTHRETMAAQIAAVRILNSLTEKKFYVRWPNDIWSSSGKIGGILDDFSATGGRCTWLNLGIGINLTSCPKIQGADCVEKSGIKITRSEFLQAFIKEFKTVEKNAMQKDSSLVNEWNSLCFDTGKKIRLESGSEFIFSGINEFGFAQLKSEAAQISLIPGQDSFLK
ncbi:biotin--[acetyl-CoA-carboxylase] ligase [Treponema sp.]|uniref:biotin--[acetyl-CoA-carboxylase] ligase n=1 Tax=Treponema sp. TaxID=166 RepID=UPI003F1072F9